MKEISATETGKQQANLHLKTSIFIYCDIVEPQIVGDKTIPLLGIAPSDSSGKVYEKTYTGENIRYIPVQTRSFQNIKIHLRSSTYEPIPFEHGRASVNTTPQTFKILLNTMVYNGQSGQGFKDIFRNVGRVLKPALKPALKQAKEIGTEVGLGLAGDLISDLVSGNMSKAGVKARGKQAKDRAMQRAMQKIQGGSGMGYSRKTAKRKRLQKGGKKKGGQRKRKTQTRWKEKRRPTPKTDRWVEK